MRRNSVFSFLSSPLHFTAHMIKHIILNCERLRFCLFKRIRKTRATFHRSWTYSVNAVCLGDSLVNSTILLYFFLPHLKLLSFASSSAGETTTSKKKTKNENVVVFFWVFGPKCTDRMTKVLARLGST